MSQKKTWPNDLSVESVPSTTIDLLVQKPSQISTDAKLKSAQELLFEAASEKSLEEKYQEKWRLFERAVARERVSKGKLMKIIGTLDEDKQWAALHYAVDSNNKDLCRRLTSKKGKYRCDVNILGGNGENILHVVSQSKQIWLNMKEATTAKVPPLVTLLVEECRADVNHADDEGRTPLHMAAMRGRLCYIKYLIDHGAKIEVLTKLNASILHFAVFPVNPMNAEELNCLVKFIMEQLLAKDKDFFNLCTLDNRKPLVFLASHPAITHSSLNDPNGNQQAFKDTLMTLFTNRTTVETQFLVVFDMVARRKQCQQFDHLENLFGKATPQIQEQIVHLACRYDNAVLLQWLIKRLKPKAHSSMTNCAEYTPLLTAIFYNSVACNIEYKSQSPLLEVGAVEQDNILHICAKRQVSSAILDMIIKKLSADNIRELMAKQDSNDNLPLHFVAQINTEKELAIWEKLINENISQILDLLSIKNRRGKTVVHEASEQGNVRILELMWKAIPSNYRYDRTKGLYETDDNTRFTCLHIATKNGGGKKLEVLKYLIETVRIEVDAIGDRRLTPLHLACEYGHLDVVKYLIEKGASTTLRNAQLLNCLEICIEEQHVELVKYLLQLPNWREMMRNAQIIEDTDAYDTPMRKLIRYMPDVALWVIEEKLTRKVGGAGQKVSKEIYDYEFYEDMNTVKQWYAQGAELPPEDTSCKARCHKLGVSAIFGCYISTGCCNRTVSDENINASEPYTRDAYTLVRNHPLMIVSQQSAYPELMAHQFHILLRKKMFRRFSTFWLAFSFLFYLILLGLWTAVILSGKHPQYFYDLAGFNMTLDINTCQQVANSLVAQNVNEVFKTDAYRRLKVALYIVFWMLIAKNGILVIALFPKVFRVGAYYVEAAALVLSFVYILDWYDWQNPVLFRCPFQYQIGAMGLFLSWMNLLTYVRCIPWLGVGIYVAMLQVICFKFLRFLPVLLIIICGFGFTYWMLLQNQPVYATPIEALIRTSLMMFDLGYESRLYSAPDQVAYYKLVYVMMILTAIVSCIFIINLLIGLAVGEIPTLMVEGTLWRNQMLYDFVSDGEILRLQFLRLMKFLCCYQLYRISRIRARPIHLLTFDDRANGWIGKAWYFTKKHFFEEKIQDDVELKISSNKDARPYWEEKEN
ncbi:unnamed protein product [Adineta steineri]|uniref:Ion transport domain-containing protein n=1 Tax=Adineta steineri TaxID=433720 RepID=A0A818VSK1_9BILA|nr:unnamed protein product [Adineta steineri]